MSVEERIAKLETAIEFILLRMDRIVDFEFHMLYTVMGALAAIAFLVIKRMMGKDKEDE